MEPWEGQGGVYNNADVCKFTHVAFTEVLLWIRAVSEFIRKLGQSSLSPSRRPSCKLCNLY